MSLPLTLSLNYMFPLRPNKNVKFFVRVVLPLIEKYFGHTRHYFTAVATAASTAGVSTIKEKE